MVSSLSGHPSQRDGNKHKRVGLGPDNKAGKSWGK